MAQNGGTGPALNEVRSAPGVQVIARDGSFTQFGQHMTSPNDLCFGPDGLLYVTDPTRKPERDDGRLWRCDVTTGECTLLFECNWYPNGIGFDAESRLIYIADSRHRRIVTVPINAPDLNHLETVFVLDHGSPDGFAFDANGDLVIGCPDFGESGGDVQVYREGKLIEIIKPGLSKHYTNVALSNDSQIYICDADQGTLLAQPWRCAGLRLHPLQEKR